MGSDHGTDNRWQGYSHQELYDRLHTGPGGSAAGAVADNWSGLSEALSGIQQDIDNAVRASGATWTGAAADNARAATGPLADWATRAAAAADTMRLRTESQGTLLGDARATMPPPIPVHAEVPSDMTLDIAAVIRAQGDYEVHEAISDAAEREAFRVMAGYESGTADNVGALAEFDQPPPVVLDTQPIVVRSNGIPTVVSVGSPSAQPTDTTTNPTTSPTTVAGPTTPPQAPTPVTQPLDIVVEANFPVDVRVSGPENSPIPVIVENHSPG